MSSLVIDRVGMKKYGLFLSQENSIITGLQPGLAGSCLLVGCDPVNYYFNLTLNLVIFYVINHLYIF